MRESAMLADDLKVTKAFEQSGADGGALADEYQRFRVVEPFREDVYIFSMFIPYLYVMPGKLFEAP
jgi:hypothetical protein